MLHLDVAKVNGAVSKNMNNKEKYDEIFLRNFCNWFGDCVFNFKPVSTLGADYFCRRRWCWYLLWRYQGTRQKGMSIRSLLALRPKKKKKMFGIFECN